MRLGNHFESFEEITSEMSNLLICSETCIRVKRNICDFMPATNGITDFKQGNIFLNFNDIEVMDPPSNISQGHLLKKIPNPVNLPRMKQLLQDEEAEVDIFYQF